jgi:hypothetical protein
MKTTHIKNLSNFITSILFISITFFSCGNPQNEEMNSLLNHQKTINDSLDYYKNIDSRAKLAVDTLSDSDLLRVGSEFIDMNQKIRLEVGPNIWRLEALLKKVNYSIDSLNKLK